MVAQPAEGSVGGQHDDAHPGAAAGSEGVDTTYDRSASKSYSIDEIVRVEEVENSEFYIGSLFRRRFGSDPPDYPRHFIALHASSGNCFAALGYVHHSAYQDMFLCGGLVIDERAYRRIPAPDRQVIKAGGGIAEKLLRDTFARLAYAPAIWAYVGDKRSEVVCVRAGFRHIEHAHLMVKWNADLSESERAERSAQVIAVGPF